MIKKSQQAVWAKNGAGQKLSTKKRKPGKKQIKKSRMKYPLSFTQKPKTKMKKKTKIHNIKKYRNVHHSSRVPDQKIEKIKKSTTKSKNQKMQKNQIKNIAQTRKNKKTIEKSKTFFAFSFSSFLNFLKLFLIFCNLCDVLGFWSTKKFCFPKKRFCIQKKA